jgi:hypothetical protein
MISLKVVKEKENDVISVYLIPFRDIGSEERIEFGDFEFVAAKLGMFLVGEVNFDFARFEYSL